MTAAAKSHSIFFSLEGVVPDPRAERSVEFGDQVSREFQNGQRDDEINQHPLVDGCDCAREEA